MSNSHRPSRRHPNQTNHKRRYYQQHSKKRNNATQYDPRELDPFEIDTVHEEDEEEEEDEQEPQEDDQHDAGDDHSKETTNGGQSVIAHADDGATVIEGDDSDSIASENDDMSASASPASASSSSRPSAPLPLDLEESDTDTDDTSANKQKPPQPLNSVTYAYPLVSPYHAPSRLTRTPPIQLILDDDLHCIPSLDSPNDPTSPSSSHSSSSSTSRHRSLSSHDLDGELFNWSGPLPRVPFFEDASRNVINLYSNPRAHEGVVWVGLCCCLDALLYCFSFLPFKILIAVLAWIRSMIARMIHRLGEIFCCRQRRPKSRRTVSTSTSFDSTISDSGDSSESVSHTALQPQHIHALLQGLIITFALLGVNMLIEYVNLNTYKTISKMASWVKLYVLFNLFAVFDLILERVGKRMTGYLNWAVVVGNRTSRVAIVAASSAYVLLHCLVLTCQISTIHSAVDNGAEVLGVLINVKLSDLKDGFRTSLDHETLFKLSLQDVANRFKWIVFLFLIGIQKLFRLYTLPTVAELQQIRMSWSWLPFIGRYQHTEGWIEGWWKSVVESTFMSQISSLQYWSDLATTCMASFRSYVSELIVGTFSPSISAAISSDAVYVLPVAPGLASLNKSPFQLFTSKPPTFASIGTIGDEQSIDPTLLLVDAISILPVWLPTFLYSAVVTFIIVCMIDFVKHSTLALFNPDWLTPRVYKSHQKRLSSFFLLAPKLGLGDQKSSSFALAHFDFISLPLTVMIVRELWSMSIAVVNSCWWGSLWLDLLGKNVIIDTTIRQRCAIWYQQVHLLNASLTYTIPIPPPSLAGVTPSIRAQWLMAEDPNNNFWLAASLLFAFRVGVFVFMCCCKVMIRLILRAYAKRHHERDLSDRRKLDASLSLSSNDPSPQPSPKRTRKHRKDSETSMLSPTSTQTTPARSPISSPSSSLPSSAQSRAKVRRRKQVSLKDQIQFQRALEQAAANQTSQAEVGESNESDDGAGSIFIDDSSTYDRRKSVSLYAILKHAIKSK